jgi:asparagine synthase (glutamine-hydrolysing)
VCGIAGLFNFGRSHEIDLRTLERMRDVLRHRGPDGDGMWISGDRRVGLAHTRLAILDIAGGKQPMVHPDGYVVVYNGEIYNYPELRRSLEKRGVPCRTRCDTEVILHLYALYGRNCVEHLKGMFAFVVWDPHREQLFFARDRVGEKPLYFVELTGSFAFASEIKSLLEQRALTAEVNEGMLDAYLANLVTSSPETLFAGIKKLPPGHCGTCSPRGIATEAYWNLASPRAFSDISFDEASASVRTRLARAVEERLLSDVPVGVLLSGGLDSTTLVALLSEKAAGVATFSVGFPAEALDERKEATRVARHFKTDHHEVVLTQEEALGFLPKLLYHQDEPLADPVCIPLYFVCGLARGHGVPVVLAGEGSDELFWGYDSYSRIMARERWLRALLRMPRTARAAVAAAAPKSHPRLRELVEGIATGRPLPLNMPLGLTYRQREAILARSDLERRAGWSPSQATKVPKDPIECLGFDTQEYEFGLRLPELLLMRIDRFAMAHGVEARVPFLDPELVSYVYRLPIEHKMHRGEGKRVLKAAIADIVPTWVIERPKQGFGAPVATWFGSLFGLLLDDLGRSDAIQRYFDTETIAKALRAAQRHERHQMDLWPVLNFALWHRRWIEGEELDTVIERTQVLATS